MPSFLNKVFGHKKHDDRDLPRDAPDSAVLLDGKYEAVPPPAAFAETTDRDLGFSLFKLKSRALSQKAGRGPLGAVPRLTLRLPGAKDSSDARALGFVFEVDPDAQLILDDAAIADKRLPPLDALVLIRPCAQAIIERGLETLGVMHPHWLSASPDVQRRLISLFIRSLPPPTRTPTLPPSPAPTFESGALHARSPHDVAAVLRWGLRHLALEKGHFGKNGTEWEWYRTFFLAERQASYPPNAFSQLLLPQLPPSHVELLTVTLGLISSLASHAETNGISGSKLSKFLGIWLLLATRTDESDDWSRFYARWEHAGRVLEHLFLARLREESLQLRLPTRLQELVQHYPYNKGSPTTDDDLLSRPRFTTRRYDALCVRVETVLTRDADQPKQHPLQLLFDAFQLPVDNPSEDAHVALWSTLKTLAFEGSPSSCPEGPQFARIFVDETLQLLSLISDGSSVASPTLVTSPVSKAVSRKRSSSPPKALERAPSWSNTDGGLTPVSSTSPSSAVITDWAQFSLAGFGDTPTTQPLVAPLTQDEDTEVTQPHISPKSSQRRGKSRSRRRRSRERGPGDTHSHGPEPSVVETRLASVQVVHVDEAFIDFWSDAVVDPISAGWPTFVLCGLKDVPSTEPSVRWLVIEQTYSRQQPLSSRNPSPDGHRGRSPRPSFKSDMSGFRINSVFSSARKRFSLFSKSATDVDSKKPSGKTATTGELGEVLVEEEPTFPTGPSTNVDQHVDASGALGAIIASGVTAGIADQLRANAVHTAPILPTDPVSVHKEASAGATAEAPSAEPTPLSGGGDSSRSHPSVEQGSSHTAGFAGQNVDNATGPLTRIDSVAAATADLQPSDPTVHVTGPTAENPIAEDGQPEVEPLRQDVAGDTDPRPVDLVALPVDGLSAEPCAKSSSVVQADVTKTSREAAETVAMPPAPDRVMEVVEKPMAPSGVVEESAASDPCVPSREAPANVAASAAAPVDPHGTDDLPPLPATEVEHKIITPEAPTQLEPHLTVSVAEVDEVKGVAEPVEIPTPAPEFVALVVETPGPEVYADAHEPAGTAQVPANVPEVVDGSVPQPTAADPQAVQEAEESSVAHPAEDVPSVEIVPAVDTGAPSEAEHAADQASDLPMEEAELSVQGAIVQVAEALPVQDEASAGIVSAPASSEGITPAEVGDHVASGSLVVDAGIAETRDVGAPTPVLENPAPVDETPGPEMTTEQHVPVEPQPTAAPESEVAENKAVQSAVQPTREAAGLSTEPVPLAEDVQPCTEAELSAQEPPSIASVLKDGTAALVTADDMSVVAKPEEAQPIRDLLTDGDDDDDPEAHAVVLENALVAGRPAIAVEASQRDVAETVPSTATDPESVQDETAEPVDDKGRVRVEDAAGSTDAPRVVDVPIDPVPVAAHHVQPPVELEAPSVAQTVDDVVYPPVEPAPLAPTADVPIEEEEEGEAVVADERETPVAEPKESLDDGAPTPVVVDTRFPLVEAEAEEADVSVIVVEATEEDDVSERLVSSTPTATIDVDEIIGSREEVDEQSTRAPVDVLTHEPGEPAESQDSAHGTA